MVRLCSESSRSYSGRPVARARRQRWGRWPEMVVVREQESAEAVVPRATSRERPDGLTTREGLNLAGRTRPSVVLTRSDEADRLSIGQRSPWQRKSAAPSARTARNRRTRTRMYGGVGAGRGNPPGDPIRLLCHTLPQSAQNFPRLKSSPKVCSSSHGTVA
jgi:hypothetical protein